MKVILCHNYYQQRGGEDQIFEDESDLLESHGHQVVRYTKTNDDIDQMSLTSVARMTLWNHQSVSEISNLIAEHQPDVIHSINTFPLISPALFHAVRRANVPMVCTIQNYRFFCAQSMCFRDGKACESCLGRVPWRAVRHACYRGSRIGSAVVASMQMLHRQRRTWQEMIDVVCLASEFSKSKYLAAGFSEDQLAIKPNFIRNDPGMRDGRGGYAVFVGRLASEKGVRELLEAWKKLPADIGLKIVGDGPLRGDAEALAQTHPHVQCVGHQTESQVFELVGDAACLIFPSTGYESLPKTLIESMAVGTPVIGADQGSVPEIVRQDDTGHLFQVGDPEDLARVTQQFFEDPSQWSGYRERCRAAFESRFTAEQNYRALTDLYREAIRRRHGSDSVGVADEMTPTRSA